MNILDCLTLEELKELRGYIDARIELMTEAGMKEWIDWADLVDSTIPTTNYPRAQEPIAQIGGIRVDKDIKYTQTIEGVIMNSTNSGGVILDSTKPYK